MRTALQVASYSLWAEDGTEWPDHLGGIYVNPKPTSVAGRYFATNGSEKHGGVSGTFASIETATDFLVAAYEAKRVAS